MVDLTRFIARSGTFDTLRQDQSDFYGEMTYQEFYNWNIVCISELPREDEQWLKEACRRIQHEELKLLDGESISNFYFDLMKHVCFV
jgi:hypothetical protein